jgi:hypothetical protein
MPDRSFGVSVVPRDASRLFTGPMTLAGLALAAGALTRLSGLDRAGFSFCYFKALTGYACFTCGTTRALGSLSRFDLPGAFAIQPLVTAGTLVLLTWGAVDAVLLLVSKRTRFRLEGRALRIALFAGLALAILNWIYLLAEGV